MKSGVCLAACAGFLGALNGCDSNVHVSQANRYGYADGASTERPWSTGRAVSARAYVQTNGGTTAIEGVVDSNGGVTLSGVPDGPYLLELRDPPPADHPNDPPYVVQYPITSGRHVRIGDDYWARADVPQATPHTGVALTTTAATAFQQGDQLAIVSLRSYLYRTLNVDSSSTTQTNAPADGATSTAAWTSNLEDMGAPYGSDASGLPSASAGDDLTLFHSHSETASASTDNVDPWSSFWLTRVVGRLDVQGATLAAGATTAITGAFVAPTTASLTLDYDGASFAAIRAAAGYPATATSNVGIEFDQEAGAGPGYFTSVAPASWSVFTSGVGIPANPMCFDDGSGNCDMTACPSGCSPDLAGYRDPGALHYTFDAPRAYASGMRDVLSAGVTFNLSWHHPTTNESATLSASTTVYRPAGGTLALTLGPVQNIRVGGMALPWDSNTTGVGATPAVSFDPPTLGTSEYYRVEVVEQRPDPMGSTGARPSRIAATLFTHATSVQIPEGVLREGYFYYVRVYANRDGRDFSTGGRISADVMERTATFAGVFSP